MYRLQACEQAINDWKCNVCVPGTDIVQREIDIGSTIGNKIQEMLMKGEALPSEFVIQMLK